ncbi:MAG: COX15/CtaA family protein [Gammaproteobacteria bacterium]|nr:COX15/CtaA family protein [Gammaproteobacteria bacterium]
MQSVSTASPDPRSPSPRTDSLYTLLVFLSLVLVLVVVILSAYLRLAGSGLGCAEWPACYALIKCIWCRRGPPSFIVWRRPRSAPWCWASR